MAKFFFDTFTRDFSQHVLKPLKHVPKCFSQNLQYFLKNGWKKLFAPPFLKKLKKVSKFFVSKTLHP